MSDIMLHNVWRGLRSAFLASALVSLTACGGGGDGPTGPKTGGNVTGTYTLEEADDEALPVAIHHGAYLDPATGAFYNNYVFEIEGGYIEVREDETFYAAFDIRLTVDGQSAQGTFEMEGLWDEVPDGVRLRVQFPVTGTLLLERRDDGSGLHTDLDFLGLGEETHLDFDFFKR